jgi:hypothetical protein
MDELIVTIRARTIIVLLCAFACGASATAAAVSPFLLA